MTQYQYSFIHRIKKHHQRMTRNKTSGNKSRRDPRILPGKGPMTLHGTFQQRAQLGEETSAANPEPQRQFETDGDQDVEPGNLLVLSQNAAAEITVLPQQPPLPEPQPEPEPDSGTMADGISVEADVAARALEELKRDGAFDCEPYFEYIMNNDDLFYDEPQQWRPRSSVCN